MNLKWVLNREHKEAYRVLGSVRYDAVGTYVIEVMIVKEIKDWRRPNRVYYATVGSGDSKICQWFRTLNEAKYAAENAYWYLVSHGWVEKVTERCK